LRPDAIAMTDQPARSHRIDRKRILHPPGESASITTAAVVTTRQNRHTSTRCGRTIQNQIRQATAGVDGYDDVSWQNFHCLKRAGVERDTASEPWPVFDERSMEG